MEERGASESQAVTWYWCCHLGKKVVRYKISDGLLITNWKLNRKEELSLSSRTTTHTLPTCAVRKEEGSEKSLCLATFGRWGTGNAQFCDVFRCVSEVCRREEGEGRTEAKRDGKRKTLH